MQSELLGAVNEFMDENDVVLCAAGSAPEIYTNFGEQKTQGFHLEYGNSCMGYEIPGGLGVKMADPSRKCT